MVLTPTAKAATEDPTASPLKERYGLIFTETGGFKALNKGHRRKLYTRLGPKFQPPISVITFKTWFLYPDEVLNYKPDRRDYILEAMNAALSETLKEALAEIKAKEEALVAYRKSLVS